MNCSPEQVIVVAGAQAALDLSARLLLDPGDWAWIEDPGYSGTRAALLGVGARIEAVPVDAEGLDVAAGEARCPHARLACITPSCQFPLGMTLSLERRLLLLDWAERAGAFVIEDDYAASTATGAGRLPRCKDSTCMAGSPMSARSRRPCCLRCGWAKSSPPPGLEAAFAHAVRNIGHTVAQPVQGTLAEFIDSDHYAACVRRMRAPYASRQGLFCALVREHLDGVLDLVPTEGGMQVAGWFVVGMDDGAVAEAGMRAGLAWSALSRYYGPGSNARPGGHFLGIAHTLARFETVFFAPKRLGNTSFEQWTAPTASSRW